MQCRSLWIIQGLKWTCSSNGFLYDTSLLKGNTWGVPLKIRQLHSVIQCMRCRHDIWAITFMNPEREKHLHIGKHITVHWYEDHKFLCTDRCISIESMTSEPTYHCSFMQTCAGSIHFSTKQHAWAHFSTHLRSLTPQNLSTHHRCFGFSFYTMQHILMAWFYVVVWQYRLLLLIYSPKYR